MKKFITGFLVGAMLFSVIGTAAISYVADVAGFKVLVNGEEFVSDPPALVVEGRTYLPLRAMGDALGVPVVWNSELGQAEVGTSPSNYTAENTVQINDKWKMSLLGCKSYKEISQFTKAEEGKEIVVATFELENITTEKQSFSFLFLSTYFDDYKTPITILGEQIDGATQLAAADIEAGKKIKGYLAYQVEPGWNKIDIIYNDELFAEDDSNALKFNIK